MYSARSPCLYFAEVFLLFFSFFRLTTFYYTYREQINNENYFGCFRIEFLETEDLVSLVVGSVRL